MNRAHQDLPIGIDLGTSYSCVAVWRHRWAEIIPDEMGNRTTPSCVAFNGTERLIGHAAKAQASINPTNTIFGHFPFLSLSALIADLMPVLYCDSECLIHLQMLSVFLAGASVISLSVVT